MISEQARAAGLAATRASKTQERGYANWLAGQWYPDAGRTLAGVTGGGHGDLNGVGPRIIEVTVMPWNRMPEKLRQAEHDAQADGLGEYWVWKAVRPAAHERGGPGRSVMVGRAEVVWPLLAELDELRREAGR